MSKSVMNPALTLGAIILIPLNRLIKSPDNVRKTPHSAATLDGLRASIAAKGILQNLVVSIAHNDEGRETGDFHVIAGEGRRLAQIARAKAGEIPEDEPMPCAIRQGDDAQEISLDENVTREAMHPADQFEAFRALNTERGMDVTDIAARFGVSDHTVRQRLRLGAVSPALLQAYRDDKLNLNQLMAFAVTEDHGRQESVFERLTGYKDPYHIKRLLTEGQVPHTDRRARFVGTQTYENAGGVIARDLFTDEGGGYFTDPALLDAIVLQRLTAMAVAIQGTEGWKWAEAYIDFPYSLGLGRVYTEACDLSPDDAAALATAQSAYNALAAENEGVEELPEEIDRQFGTLETEIERLEALKEGYAPDDVARGGIIVSLSNEGTARIERGLIRSEDELPEPEREMDEPQEDGTLAPDSPERREAGDAPDEDEAIDDTRPLSDILWRDLTTHRTLALRLTLGEQPELAMRVLTHKLVFDTFYRPCGDTCIEIRAQSADIAGFADGLDQVPTALALWKRHTTWGAGLPEQPGDLWEHVLAMDPETLGALMAHCVGLSVNAVRQPYAASGPIRAAERLAQQLQLDMNEHWRPTARSYFNRVSKGQILAAVCEATSGEAAERLTKLKKPEMADCAEQLMVGTGWLPACLRTAALPEDEGERPAEPAEVAAAAE